jgi:hypothetical protein
MAPPFVPSVAVAIVTPSARFTDSTNEQHTDVPIVTFDARTVTRWPAVPWKVSSAFWPGVPNVTFTGGPATVSVPVTSGGTS